MRGLFLLFVAAAACARPMPDPGWCHPADRSEFKISYCLKLAMRIQKHEEPERGSKLRELMQDPSMTTYCFPLCRMLFEAREGGEFRRPMLGAPSFIGNRAGNEDWPLEPIELYQGMPILVVRGYELAGFPEPPLQYLEYCLLNCDWRTHGYELKDTPTLRRLLREYIDSRPQLSPNEEWLMSQAN